jgi:diaminohydroxyphosphoribosylaminopyrimidine deaminase/5-amino-6-(5-phosphoribosylamino)uracil reductase
VILKAGMSVDGRIASQPGQQTAITGKKSRRRVHVLRGEVDAILVGIGTVLADDPSLTCRLGRPGSDPLRVILDADLRLSVTSKVLQQKSAAETWVFCAAGADNKKRRSLAAAGAKIKTVPLAAGGLDLRAVLKILGKAGVTSLLVEGGSRVHGSFLDAALADQLFLFVAPTFIGSRGEPLATFPPGRKKKHLPGFRFIKTRRYGDDILLEGRFFNP